MEPGDQEEAPPTTNEPVVTIPMKAYERLCEDSEFLQSLRAAGVDNWSGYDFAIEIHNETFN